MGNESNVSGICFFVFTGLSRIALDGIILLFHRSSDCAEPSLPYHPARESGREYVTRPWLQGVSSVNFVNGNGTELGGWLASDYSAHGAVEAMRHIHVSPSTFS